jgi:Ulp1 family protease
MSTFEKINYISTNWNQPEWLRRPVRVRTSELTTLLPTRWVAGEIIDFVLHTVTSQGNDTIGAVLADTTTKIYQFNQRTVTPTPAANELQQRRLLWAAELVKSKNIVLVPFNPNGSHWSLGVIDKNARKFL